MILYVTGCESATRRNQHYGARAKRIVSHFFYVSRCLLVPSVPWDEGTEEVPPE